MAGPQRRTNNEQVLDDSIRFPESFSPPVYNQERMNNFNETFGNLADATLDEALAAKVIRDVIRKNNLTEEDISIESLRNGTAPILDTFTFQNKKTEAISVLDKLISEQNTHAIVDEALLLQAELFESTTQNQKAKENYLRIIGDFSSEILIDDAHFALA